MGHLQHLARECAGLISQGCPHFPGIAGKHAHGPGADAYVQVDRCLASPRTWAPTFVSLVDTLYASAHSTNWAAREPSEQCLLRVGRHHPVSTNAIALLRSFPKYDLACSRDGVASGSQWELGSSRGGSILPWQESNEENSPDPFDGAIRHCDLGWSGSFRAGVGDCGESATAGAVWATSDHLWLCSNPRQQSGVL